MSKADPPLPNRPSLSAGYLTKTLSEDLPKDPGGVRSILRLVPSRVMENPETLRPKTLVVLAVALPGREPMN